MNYVYKKYTSLLLIIFLSCFSLKGSGKNSLKIYSALFTHLAGNFALKVYKPDIKISKIKCPHLNKLSSEIMSKLILNPGLKDIINSMSISLVGNKEILRQMMIRKGKNPPKTWNSAIWSIIWRFLSMESEETVSPKACFNQF